jgi:SNF2 family DNA or RNA helicase
MMNFVNPGLLGTQSTFQRVFAQPIEASRESDASQNAISLGQARAHELSRIIAPFQLRRMADINNKYLLPCLRYVVFCRPTEKQVATYKRIILDQSCLKRPLSTREIDNTQMLALISKLRQVCNHPDLATLAPEVRADICVLLPSSSPSPAATRARLGCCMHADVTCPRRAAGRLPSSSCLTQIFSLFPRLNRLPLPSRQLHPVCVSSNRFLCTCHDVCQPTRWCPFMVAMVCRCDAPHQSVTVQELAGEEQAVATQGTAPASSCDPSLSSKLVCLQHMLHEIIMLHEKAVAVCTSTKMLDLAESMCCAVGLQTARIDGSTAAQTRQQLVDSFNAPNSMLKVRFAWMSWRLLPCTKSSSRPPRSCSRAVERDQNGSR